MAAKKMSPELKIKMTMVATAARALPSHHFVWIIDAAINAFKDKIKNTENEIVRHTYFKDRIEDNLENGSVDDTRHALLSKLEDTRVNYRNILHFLLALRAVSMEFQAEQFAADMADIFGWKKR